MTVANRIRRCKLIEKIEENKKMAHSMGISNVSIYKAKNEKSYNK